MEPYLLPHADISWHSDNTPFAPQYEDIYWSNSGGAAEKQHVFIDGCQLPEKWRVMSGSNRFTVLELGFGFGLNFLLALRAWRADRTEGASLQYLAFEKHLVPYGQLEKMAKAFGLESELQCLADQYPEPIPGPHIIKLDCACDLTLVVGDALAYSQYLQGEIDCVFLDGFSPSRNDSLWQPPLLSRIAQHLRPGAVLSTYSVAGALRRQLSEMGLELERPDGYGTKRQMLRARAPGTWQPATRPSKHIAIVGAGLTGLFSAAALQRAGHQVSVFDQTGQRLGAVKNIQQIAIYPQLSQTPQPYSNLYLRAFQHFLATQAFEQCGRLELLSSEEKLTRAEKLTTQLTPLLRLIDSSQSSDLCGIQVKHPGLYNPSAGWLDPSSIDVNCEIIQGTMTAAEPIDNQWQLTFDGQSQRFDAVVLATGAAELPMVAPLNLMPLRGQSLRIKSERSPHCVLSGEKTWFPNNASGQSTVSGTYSRFDTDLNIREADSTLLLNGIRPYLSEPTYEAHVGIRSATRDRMPILGRLPDWGTLGSELRQGTAGFETFSGYQPNLFISVGYGSHAGTLGPYCAEILARIINQEVLVENFNQLSSIRFAIRDGKI